MPRIVESITVSERNRRIGEYEAKRDRSWCPCCIARPDLYEHKMVARASTSPEKQKPQLVRPR